MLDPIVSFFARLFQLVGRGLGLLVGVLLWPFLWLGRWYGQRGWILRGVVGAVLAVIVGLYGYFFYVTQFWNGFDPDYPAALVETRGTEAAGQPLAATGSGQSCKPSAIATVAADLVDLNVNRNAWISSMLVS
jgi:hypothetical protein